MRACNHCGSMTSNCEFVCGNCGEPSFKPSLETTPTLMLCQMRARIAQLEAENARLRGQLRMSMPIAGNHPLQPGSGGISAAALQPEERAPTTEPAPPTTAR